MWGVSESACEVVGCGQDHINSWSSLTMGGRRVVGRREAEFKPTSKFNYSARCRGISDSGSLGKTLPRSI